MNGHIASKWPFMPAPLFLCGGPTEQGHRMTEPSVIATVGSADFQVRLGDGTHQWIADEPESLGGRDTGPSPASLILSGLGACTSITLRMYAKRKAWPLDSLQVTLSMTSTADGTVIDRQIQLAGALSDEQRERLLHIANSCPMHKVLSGSIRIDTALAPA
jgi:putative redox protein